MKERPSKIVWTMVHGKRTKKDMAILAAIVIVAVVFLIYLGTVIFGVIHTNRYLRFVDEFTTSANIARRNGGIEVVHGDDRFTLSLNNGSYVYKCILDAGMGKPQEEPPGDGDIYILYFHDGAMMELCATEIMEQTRQSDVGVFIRYTNTKGEVYCYDTDLIEPKYFFGFLRE